MSRQLKYLSDGTSSIFSSEKLATLSVFHCLRILLRYPELLLVFIEENGLIGLKNVCLLSNHSISNLYYFSLLANGFVYSSTFTGFMR
jgi:hypothetical protein